MRSRSYPTSLNFLTTGVSPGTLSNAVRASRSMGCTYSAGSRPDKITLSSMPSVRFHRHTLSAILAEQPCLTVCRSTALAYVVFGGVRLLLNHDLLPSLNFHIPWLNCHSPDTSGSRAGQTILPQILFCKCSHHSSHGRSNGTAQEAAKCRTERSSNHIHLLTS